MRICRAFLRTTYMSETIKVPLRKNHHTVLTGNFLMQNASGGIDINPGFDGNYNIVIP